MIPFLVHTLYKKGESGKVKKYLWDPHQKGNFYQGKLLYFFHIRLKKISILNSPSLYTEFSKPVY